MQTTILYPLPIQTVFHCTGPVVGRRASKCVSGFLLRLASCPFCQESNDPYKGQVWAALGGMLVDVYVIIGGDKDNLNKGLEAVERAYRLSTADYEVQFI